MSDLERQRWLAGMALLAAIPLPITGIATWPFVLPYMLVAGWLLTRPRAVSPLPPWVENLLAPCVLVVVAAAGGLRFGVLRPVAQLAVLVAMIRLPGCASSGRIRKTLIITSIIGMAGVASSTHPSLLAYLLVVLALGVLGVGRVTLLELRKPDQELSRRAAWPTGRLVVGTVALTMLIAAPLFALLPRLRSPFAGSAIGGGGTSGFRNDVTLHDIGTIKVSQQVALTVRFPGADGPPREWLRLEGATLNHYRAGGWVEGRHVERLPLPSGGQAVSLWPVADARGLQRAEITVERPGGNLFLPPGSVSLEPPLAVEVSRTPMGVLRIRRDTPVPFSYAVSFDPLRLRTRPPEASDLEVPGHVRERITPLVEDVVVGSPNSLAAALAIERHLQTEYTYSLHTMASLREDPVVWFLFRGRQGHCEFFASAMAMMLRVAGIPARVQVGFSGGEQQGDGSFVVRDSRAHAWVLAWVAGQWRVFDPTPPEGQPSAAQDGWRTRLPWSLDDLDALWNRWVLTFTLFDQAEILRTVATWAGANIQLISLVLGAAVGLAGLVVGLWRWRPSRRPGPGSGRSRGSDPVVRALEKVLDQARRRGLDVRPSLSPQVFGALAAAAFPAAREPLAWLMVAHERRRYAGGPPPARRDLRRHLALALRAMTAHPLRRAP
ncbi:MAG TPA: transglutaminaseTgpA domain-containing protein [Thermoanaerobaculaceae bacterium]|nr:transglutaminaseTgpA domain-containing protein [Thermoanaerobaculaceae bacterium]